MHKEIDAALCSLTMYGCIFYILWFIFSVAIGIIQHGKIQVHEAWIAGFATAIIGASLAAIFAEKAQK